MQPFSLYKYSMPLTVFPAPGCYASKQFLTPFSSFDIGPYSGGVFKNLLLYSENQGNPVWTKGSGTTVVPEFDGTGVIKYSTPAKNNSLNWYSEYPLDSDLFIMPVASPIPALGQTVTVTPNTTYTFSFHAKTGTASTATYGVYDNTNTSNLVSPTSYISQLNAKTFTRLSVTFTTGNNCTSITVYPLWTGSSTGTVTIFGTQLELGNTASVYQSTQSLSFAAKGYIPQTIPTYSYASKIKDSFVLKSAPTIPAISQLQKRFEVIKSVAPLTTTAKLTRNATLKSPNALAQVAKVKGGAVLRGDKNLPFDADVVAKFKLPKIAAQIFFPPEPNVLKKQFEVIRGELTTLIPNKVLNAAAKLKSDSSKLRVDKLQSSAVLKSDRTPILDVDTVKQFKITSNAAQSFDTPQLNRLEVFQNTINQSDFRFVVTGQSPETYTTYLYPDLSTDTGTFDLNTPGTGLSDLTTVPNSLIDWYLEYSTTSETLTSATPIVSRSTVKTYTYATPNLLVNQPGGTVITAPNPISGSIQFNGTTDYLSVPYSSMILPTTTTPMTVECWINLDQAVSASIMSEEWTGSGNISMTLGTGNGPDVAGSNVWFGWYDGTTWRYAVSSQSLAAGKWYHIAGVYNGTQIQIYINGQLDGTLTYSWSNDNSATTLFIGRRWDTSVNPTRVYFPGYISTIRVVKGYALYTGAFTPSTTGLTWVTGTQLLMQTLADKTGFTDISGNALAITQYGSPKLTSNNPGFTIQTTVYTQVSNPSGVYNPFDVGSSIKVTDVKENTFYYAQVLSSSSGSVTIAQPDWFIPTTGIYLEGGATVFSKDNVDATTAPTTPRENFYYFNLIPQLRADKTRMVSQPATQAFDLPQVNTLSKQLEVIRGDKIVLTPSQLQKQIEVIRSDTTDLEAYRVKASIIVRAESSRLRAEKLTASTVLRGDKTPTLDSDIINQFKISSYTTEVFDSPLVSKLQSSSVIRDAVTAYIPGLTGAIIKSRVPDIFTEVLYAPTSSNLERQLLALRGDSTKINLDKLLSTTVIRSDTILIPPVHNFTNFISQFVFSTTLPPVNAAGRFYYFNLAPSRFADRYEEATSYTPLTEVFDSPLSSNLAKQLSVMRGDSVSLSVSSIRDGIVIRGDTVAITANNLQKQIESIKGDSNFTFDSDIISKFKIAVETTEVFDTPNTSQLQKQIEIVDGDNAIISASKLSISQVVRGDSTNMQVAKVKSGFVARSDGMRFSVDNVRNQKFISDSVSLFYTPKNDKLAASIVVRPDRSAITVNKLSQFTIDNQPGDFKLPVSGQVNAGNQNNTLLDWYFGYSISSELLSNNPVSDDMSSMLGNEDLTTGAGSVDLTPDPVTYYFTPQTFVPFDVGSRVKVTNVNTPVSFFATVTAATKNSVSFAQPAWYVTTSGTYVESGSTVFPQNYVEPLGQATNARESFYYFNIAPSIRADKYQSPNVHAFPTQIHQLDEVVYQLPKQFEEIRDFSSLTYTTDNFDNYRNQTAPVLANPVTPIENLYYFNMAPGIRADYWQHSMPLTANVEVFDTPKLLKLSASRVLRESVRSGFLVYDFSIKQLKTPATAQELFFLQDNSGAVTIQNLIRGLEINKPDINLVEKLKVNSGSVEVIYNPDSGFVVRMKTGDSKIGQRGIQDPAAQRKEPIQFWN